MPPGHDPVPGAGWWRQTTTAEVLAELIRQPQWPDVNCGMAAWWGRRPGDGVGGGHWPLAATGQCCFCHYPLTFPFALLDSRRNAEMQHDDAPVAAPAVLGVELARRSCSCWLLLRCSPEM